ncbi:hypothetical protein BSLG_005164 [Batrachochytrium salamandrivorans]|nr:hypothetical protein BSLG_005164 [Batrachochytrium salamandrivorans]
MIVPPAPTSSMDYFVGTVHHHGIILDRKDGACCPSNDKTGNNALGPHTLFTESAADLSSLVHSQLDPNLLTSSSRIPCQLESDYIPDNYESRHLTHMDFSQSASSLYDHGQQHLYFTSIGGPHTFDGSCPTAATGVESLNLSHHQQQPLFDSLAVEEIHGNSNGLHHSSNIWATDGVYAGRDYSDEGTAYMSGISAGVNSASISNNGNDKPLCMMDPMALTYPGPHPDTISPISPASIVPKTVQSSHHPRDIMSSAGIELRSLLHQRPSHLKPIQTSFGMVSDHPTFSPHSPRSTHVSPLSTPHSAISDLPNDRTVQSVYDHSIHSPIRSAGLSWDLSSPIFPSYSETIQNASAAITHREYSNLNPNPPLSAAVTPGPILPFPQRHRLLPQPHHAAQEMMQFPHHGMEIVRPPTQPFYHQLPSLSPFPHNTTHSLANTVPYSASATIQESNLYPTPWLLSAASIPSTSIDPNSIAAYPPSHLCSQLSYENVNDAPTLNETPFAASVSMPAGGLGSANSMIDSADIKSGLLHLDMAVAATLVDLEHRPVSKHTPRMRTMSAKRTIRIESPPVLDSIKHSAQNTVRLRSPPLSNAAPSEPPVATVESDCYSDSESDSCFDVDDDPISTSTAKLQITSESSPQTIDNKLEYKIPKKLDAHTPHTQQLEGELKKERHLRTHVRRQHREDRPFVCSICATSFHRKHDLSRHARSIHGEGKQFHCEPCKRSYARSDALKRHILSAAHRNLLRGISHGACLSENTDGVHILVDYQARHEHDI